MRKIRKRHVTPHRHKSVMPFNFVSGLVYASAVIVSIALGGLFYKGVRNAQLKSREGAKSEAEFYPNLPPGAKVVKRTERVETPAAVQSPSPAPKVATPVSTTSAPTAAPAPASPAPDTSTVPDIKPPRPTVWSPGYIERAHLKQARLTPVADTSVSRNEDHNVGAATELLLQGNDSMVLAQFDISRIRGWTINRATWNAKVKSGRGRALGFSALPTPWDEGKGTTQDMTTAGATFRWANYGNRPWRQDGASLPHVIRGNGGSITAFGELGSTSTNADGWISISLDPIVIQALVADAAYGMAITDAKGQLDAPLSVASREDAENSHYLEVEGALIDMAPPGDVSDLCAYAHPSLRRRDRVGILLTWTAPGDDGKEGQAFRYDVRWALAPNTADRAQDMPRNLIPVPQPGGQKDQMIVDELEPDMSYIFFVRAVDEAGQAGPFNEVTVRTPQLLSLPETAKLDAYDAAPIDVAANALGLQVIDETAAVDPINGAYADATRARAPLTSSHIWDRTSRTIRLRAARNETVSFIISLVKKGADFPTLKFSAQPLQAGKSGMPGVGFRFYRAWYTHTTTPADGGIWTADLLLPLSGSMTLSALPNRLPNQTCQSVLAELYIPASTAPGVYRGPIQITRDDGTSSELNVNLEVLPITLPRPEFTAELLAPPSLALLYKKDAMNRDDALPVEQAYYRMAREHLCTMAVLPYQRNGEATEPFAPRVAGKGVDLTIPSWQAWDDRYAGVIDGSVFSGLDQGSEPASHFILPLFENWPASLLDGFLCTDQEVITPSGCKVFSGPAEGIYSCLDNNYWRAFRSSLQKFREHLRSRGWSTTAAHLWLNNVPTTTYKGKAPPWFLGEPLFRDDFMALESYALVAASDASAWPKNKFVFRVTVPDGSLIGNYGIGVFSLLTVSDTDPLSWQRLRERQKLSDETLWLMTEGAPLGRTPLDVEATALAGFCEGADGWSIRETIGLPEHWLRGSPQSLFYCGMPANQDKPYASLRLKTLRRALQDIEYLRLLQEKKGWTREQLADFVYAAVPSLAKSGELTSDDAVRLRYTAQQELQKN